MEIENSELKCYELLVPEVCYNLRIASYLQISTYFRNERYKRG